MPRSRPTHVTYEIRTIGDLLSVPEDRIVACLKELRIALEIHHMTRRAINTVAGQEVQPLDPKTMPFWNWTDDGIKNAKVEIREQDVPASDATKDP